MKKLILLILFALGNFGSLAQVHRKNSGTNSFDDFRFTLVKNYRPDTDSVKNNCWEGCVFIRFNVSKSGRFTNIGYTAITPVFIKEGIKKAFESIDIKDVNMARFKKMPNRTFLLPFIVENKDGCGFMTGWEDQNYKPDEKITSRQMTYHQSANSIGNITRFTDGAKLDFVDCILLAPVSTPVVLY